MGKLIAYDFADRRRALCYKCGISFPEGRYREHILTSKHPSHQNDREIASKEKSYGRPRP